MLNIADLRRLYEAATPGPWKWDPRACNHDCKIVTTHSGQYYVMGFARFGTQGGGPTFQVYEKYEGPVTERHSRGMMRFDALCKSLPGKEHHNGWDDYIDHPDAQLIIAAVNALPELLDTVERLEAANAFLTGERDDAIKTIGYKQEAVDRLTAENAELREDLESADTANTALHSAWELLTAENERLRRWQDEARYAIRWVLDVYKGGDAAFSQSLQGRLRALAEQEAHDGL